MNLLRQQGVQVSLLIGVLTLTTGLGAVVLGQKNIGRSDQAEQTMKTSAIAADRLRQATVRAAEPIVDGGRAVMTLPPNINDVPGAIPPFYPAVVGSFGVDVRGVTAKAVIRKDASGQDYVAWGFPAQGPTPKK